MTDLPSFAMCVSDVAGSSAFFVEKLDFILIERRPDADIAYLRDTNGESFVLAGPDAQDVPSLLTVQHYIAQPGESLGLADKDLDAIQAKLQSRGVTSFQLKENRIGDRFLVLKLFDNYSFSYEQPAEHDFEDLLHLYTQGPADLERALSGLNEADQNLTLHEGSWSIRQIVHHLADCDLLFAQTMKVQLSSPGTIIAGAQAVGNANVSMGREYRERPVATSVALFRAFHEHILDIASYIPDAGERSISDPSGPQVPFKQLVHLVVTHTDEHLEEIGEIRRKYGK